jgi:hypothetical protein
LARCRLKAHGTPRRPGLPPSSGDQQLAWLDTRFELAGSYNPGVAIAVHLHADGMTQAQYEQVRGKASVDRLLMEGVIAQMGGPTDDGWCLVTVFQTQEMAERFVQGKLAGALIEAGILAEPELIPTFDLDD